MKKLIISLFIINLFFVSCKKPTPLENPTLSVQARSSSQVEMAIKNALTKRQWAITHQGPGVFEARYFRREAVANIKITYSKSTVSIVLVSSQNLDQTSDVNGNPTVHQTYMGWVKRLESDIYIELSKL